MNQAISTTHSRVFASAGMKGITHDNDDNNNQVITMLKEEQHMQIFAH